jgi:poly(A) polymerase
MRSTHRGGNYSRRGVIDSASTSRVQTLVSVDVLRIFFSVVPIPIPPPVAPFSSLFRWAISSSTSDCIAVAPKICTREDFFGSGYVPPRGIDDVNDDDDPNAPPRRDPDSLAERIRRHPDVTNFVPVENAAVPILTFDWEGVNIDLLFARVAAPSVLPGMDIDDDAVLSGVDSATEKSLNGPRVTNLIAALAGGTEERYRTFLTVVRLVRKWAKCRGLYSNKMGYWGGVNINIAVCLVLQLYPNACPASLLRRFFLVFKSWRWPNPVMLTRCE